MVTTLISPCGILGYGFPAASLEKALEQSPDAIVVDAGSTDAGPHKLGAGTAIVSRMAAKKDLSLLMAGARRLHIPLVIGSAGGSGARKHTQWTLDIIKEIARETGWNPRLMVIWADIPNGPTTPRPLQQWASSAAMTRRCATIWAKFWNAAPCVPSPERPRT